MARISLICLLAVASFLAPCALGFDALANQIGSIHIFNDATTDMSFRKWVLFANNTRQTDHDDSVLPKSTAYQFQVMEDVTSFFSKFQTTNITGRYDQTVLFWSSNLILPVPCLPDCFWIVDANGFSAANSAHAPLHLVTGWNGPHVPL